MMLRRVLTGALVFNTAMVLVLVSPSKGETSTLTQVDHRNSQVSSLQPLHGTTPVTTVGDLGVSKVEGAPTSVSSIDSSSSSPSTVSTVLIESVRPVAEGRVLYEDFLLRWIETGS